MPLLTAPSLITRKVAGINGNQQKSDSDMKFNTRVSIQSYLWSSARKNLRLIFDKACIIGKSSNLFLHRLWWPPLKGVRESPLGSEWRNHSDVGCVGLCGSVCLPVLCDHAIYIRIRQILVHLRWWTSKKCNSNDFLTILSSAIHVHNRV